MPIQLDEPRAPGHPVVKRQAIGETFTGAIVKFETRNVLKDGQPVTKPDGKTRQELVVTCVTMPGTNASATIKGEGGVAQPGDVVRMILRGGGFGDWINAKGALGGPLNVGDVVTQTTDHAQVYDANGKPEGGPITDQATADQVPRNKSLGFYGPLTIRRSTPADAQWVTAAEAAYHAERDRVQLSDDDGGDAPSPWG